MYGNQVRQQGRDPHQIVGTVREAIKVASNKNAAQTFRELYESNSEFRKMANQRIQESAEGFGIMRAFAPAGEVARKAAERVNSGKTKTAPDFQNLYEAFNISMVDHGKSTAPALTQFYEAFKKQGYGAINDINDQWYSGYDTNTANIVFNTEAVVKTAVRKLSNDEIDNLNATESIKTIVRQILPAIGGTAIASVMTEALNTATIGAEIRVEQEQKQGHKKKKEDDS